MKKLIIVMALLIPVAAWAECVKHDYAEIKDMTKVEMEAAFNLNFTEDKRLLELGNKLMWIGNRKESEIQYSLQRDCAEQTKTLSMVWAKKGYAPKDE